MIIAQDLLIGWQRRYTQLEEKWKRMTSDSATTDY